MMTMIIDAMNSYIKLSLEKIASNGAGDVTFLAL